MTFLKRLIVLAVVVIVGVTTRLVVRYGVDGALDLLLNAAHAQPSESEVPGGAKPGAHRPATGHPAARTGAQPALTPAAPIGAGPINAARKAVSAENAQLAAQTGQPVPAAKGAAPNPPASQAAKTPAVVQQGAPKAVATKTDSAKPAAPSGAGKVVPAPAPSSTAKGAPAANNSSVTPAPAGAMAATAGKPVTGAAATTAPAAANGKPSPTTTPAAAPSDSARAVVMRETFDYQRDGRRDPFVSLMMTSDLRPTLSDLTLKGVLYDLSGRRPIAILRDQVGGQWRVTTGMTLGRMRVAQIKPRAVIFTIEEFGFSRQDSLLLGDTTRVRSR